MAQALRRYERTGAPFSGPTDPDTAGIGSLKRLATVAQFYAGDPQQAIERAGAFRSSPQWESDT